MFSIDKTFGSSMVIGDYGDGKSFGVEDICYELKEKFKDDIYIISNIPNSIVDCPFNSLEDLRTIIDWLFRFYIETNGDIKHYNRTFRDILFVIDEVHVYFPQDGTGLSSDKDCMSKMKIIETQCRKRNTKLFLCTQRGKTCNINLRRYTDYIYMYVMQYYFDNKKFKHNTMEVYKCGGGVADLLGEDGVTWATLEDLEKDKIDTLTMKYNTFILDKIYKLEHYDWELWNEKYLTQYICGLPGDYLKIHSYDEFRQGLVYGNLELDKRFKQVFNHDSIPLFVNDMFFYASKEERERKLFI